MSLSKSLCLSFPPSTVYNPGNLAMYFEFKILPPNLPCFMNFSKTASFSTEKEPVLNNSWSVQRAHGSFEIQGLNYHIFDVKTIISSFIVLQRCSKQKILFY